VVRWPPDQRQCTVILLHRGTCRPCCTFAPRGPGPGHAGRFLRYDPAPPPVKGTKPGGGAGCSCGAVTAATLQSRDPISPVLSPPSLPDCPTAPRWCYGRTPASALHNWLLSGPVIALPPHVTVAG